MDNFTSTHITSGLEDIAGQLRAARLRMDITLKQAARQTGIRIEYLEALEKAKPEKLPAGLYGRSYLKEYALFLKIDYRPLLATYDQELAHQDTDRTEKSRLFVKRARHTEFILAVPKLAKAALIALGIFLCLAYLSFYLHNLAEPPFLELSSPATDINTAESIITITGRTEPETKVYINDESVLTDSNGNFSREINLKKGLNTINITSQKRYSQTARVVRKIFVE